MRKKLVMFAVVILMATIAIAENPQKTPQRFKSMKEATGQGHPPRSRVESTYLDGEVPMKTATSDGQKFVGGTPRVVIFRANTDAGGVTVCNDAVPNPNHRLGNGFVFFQLFSEKVIPLMPGPSFLEVIWSGQVSVSEDAQFQAGLFECTVTQGGVVVPCSGTAGIPVVAEAKTDKGNIAWVTYSGYVEIDPNIETAVDIYIHAWPDKGGVVSTCGDTLTLKY